MDDLKPETIKIVTPHANFRYSYYVTPDEFKGIKKYKGEVLIKKGVMMKDDKGRDVDAVEHIVEQLEGLLDRWKAALKEAYPSRTFTLTKNKFGEPSFPWSFEDDNLVIKVSKKAGGIKQNGDVWTNPPVTFWANEDPLRLMTDEEKKDYEKISPETVGQMSMKCQGYDAGANGVGIRCQPIQIVVRKFVPWTGSGGNDFEVEATSQEEKATTTAADF